MFLRKELIEAASREKSVGSREGHEKKDKHGVVLAGYYLHPGSPEQLWSTKHTKEFVPPNTKGPDF